MRLTTKALACVAWLLCVDVANAHHAFAPVYDANRTVTVAGVVTAFRFVNPHAQMSVDVTDDAGRVVTWNVEFDGRLNLTNGGWNDDTITVGERLSVTGNPTHTGSSRMFFVSVLKADGTALLRPAIARLQALEGQRRQRKPPADTP